MSKEMPVFTDPDPDAAREFFRRKSRRETPRLMSLHDAVARFVHDGDYLVSGGFGAVRASIAAMHEIVRQGRTGLGFAGHTSTHDIQVLTVGRAYNRVDAAYVVGLEARGLSRAARTRFESGEVQVVEDTNHGLAVRFKAAAMGVPYLPMRSSLGTDTFRYSNGRKVTCPFTGKTLVAKPALYADVAFIHVHEADQFGNARFRGIRSV
jgi:glutaconate CoA-transferase subunit A